MNMDVLIDRLMQPEHLMREWEIILFLTLLVLPFAKALPAAASRFTYLLARIGRNRKALLWTAFILPIVLRCVAAYWTGIPIPGIHDEMGHLLGADTFSHFRLTNPTPPQWISFES